MMMRESKGSKDWMLNFNLHGISQGDMVIRCLQYLNRQKIVDPGVLEYWSGVAPSKLQGEQVYDFVILPLFHYSTTPTAPKEQLFSNGKNSATYLDFEKAGRQTGDGLHKT
jgi:hypothetical protein